MQTVTSAYVSEFNRDVNTKVNEHTGYDFGELVYVDYEEWMKIQVTTTTLWRSTWSSMV